MSELSDILERRRDKNGSQRVHDAITELVFDHAHYVHQGAKIIKNYEWKKGTKSGEIDVLVEYPHKYIMYEVKSCNRKRKAQQQYKRFVRYFADRPVHGIYVSPYEVSRLR